MNGSPQVLRIFLSSTAQDMKAHRAAVKDAVERLGEHVVGMETFGAGPNPPVELCREKVLECDALVVMVSHRYGWVPGEERGGDGRKSITWLEVETALHGGIPVFAFLVDPDHPWPHEKEESRLKHAKGPEAILQVAADVQALQDFRTFLESEAGITRELFGEAADLATKVATGLASWRFKQRPGGAEPASLPFASPLRTAYLSHVYDVASPVPLSSIDPHSAADAERRLSLAQVYTALLTVATEQHMGSEGLARDRDPRLSALQQADAEARLVLTGDPGSGKSTFVNFLAACLAGESLGKPELNLAVLTAPIPLQDGSDGESRQPWGAGPLLPVVVTLKDFAARGLPSPGEEATGDHLWDFIGAELAKHSLGDYGRELREELLGRGGMLLLDGLDEVPEAKRRREQIKQAVEGFGAVFEKCRILVTSRVYAYQKPEWRLRDFAEARLAPFSEGQIRRFVDRWYDQVRRSKGYDAETAEGNAEVLKYAVFHRPRLRELAERPLLLTLMASLHAWRGGTLPDKREQLYAEAVDLLLDRWERARMRKDREGEPVVDSPSLTEWLKMDRDAVRRVLNELAFEAHESQPDLEGTADIPEARLVSLLMKAAGRPDVQPLRLVEFLSTRAGLLLPHGNGVYRYPHRTFQEYLAACYLWEHGFPEKPARLAREEPLRWREVALLACARAGQSEFNVMGMVEQLCHRSPTDPGYVDEDRWGARIAGEALAESGLDLSVLSEVNRPKLETARTGLVGLLEGGELPAVERVGAGDSLGVVGDPRFREDAWFLPADPTLGFIEVPAGDFQMGSDEDEIEAAIESVSPALRKLIGPWFRSEAPKARVDHEAFWVARYPVTNAQFGAFVESSGHPWEHGSRRPEQANHPVVNVSWHDAVAYCGWLSARLAEWPETPTWLRRRLREGQGVDLPSEAEWERAARGRDGRRFPWGDDPDPDRANYADTELGGSSAVGCFPGGVSPAGALDMGGNVWEWTRSLHRPYPYDAGDGREDIGADPDGARVVRGGAFFGEAGSVRCAFRDGSLPYARSHGLGFRVVVPPSNSVL